MALGAYIRAGSVIGRQPIANEDRSVWVVFNGAKHGQVEMDVVRSRDGVKVLAGLVSY